MQTTSILSKREAIKLAESAILRARALKREIADRENGVASGPIDMGLAHVPEVKLFDGEEIK